MIIGLFIKNYKVYNGINFIPISLGDYFSAYFGANGVGKSSILEALDTFFNFREWNINKTSSGGISYVNRPYVLPIFLIKKNELKVKTSEEKLFFDLINKISNYVWKIKNIQNTSAEAKQFIEYKEFLKEKINEDDFFILPIGIREDNDKTPYFGIFQHQKDFLALFGIEKKSDDTQTQNVRTKDEDDLVNSYFKEKGDLLGYIRQLYYYLYIPADVDVATYTKIESSDMQKLMHKDIKEEIQNAITQTKLDEINTALANYVEDVSNKLKIYTYEKPKAGKSKITMPDLVNKIIKSYFSIRVLTKIDSQKVPVNSLSSGEKRKALIDVAFAFLDDDVGHERKIILAIDEPEVSLHVSACYEQFEKLKYISSKKHQVLLTTHWYGFLPILGSGVAHSLVNDKNFEISSFALDRYHEEILTNCRRNRGKLPNDIYLKGKYDLIQSIIASLRAEKPYNYLLVEGSSDKIYLSEYLKDYCKSNNLRIMPLGGCGEVISVMKHLFIAMDDTKDVFRGKVVAIIDTDEKYSKIDNYKDSDNLFLRRIRFDSSINNISFEAFNSVNATPVTEIEDALEPNIFLKILKEFTIGDTKYSFIDKLDNEALCSYNAIDVTEKQRKLIKQFFSQDTMKTRFANSYITENLNIEKCKLARDICELFSFSKTIFD